MFAVETETAKSVPNSQLPDDIADLLDMELITPFEAQSLYLLFASESDQPLELMFPPELSHLAHLMYLLQWELDDRLAS